jgi:hypothetical protein
MVLMSEYAALFVSAVVILLIVCLRSTTRLRTRLVYFYVITIIIALGMPRLYNMSLLAKPHRESLCLARFSERLFCSSLHVCSLTLMDFDLVRVVGWSLEPWWKYSDTQWQKYLHSILFALPAMCLISTYTILVCAHLSHSHFDLPLCLTTKFLFSTADIVLGRRIRDSSHSWQESSKYHQVRS